MVTLNGNRGFSILGVLIGFALLGVLAGALSSMMTLALRGVHASAQKVQWTTLQANVSQLLANPSACAKSLASLPLSGTSYAVALKDAGGNPVYQSGTRLSDGLVIVVLQGRVLSGTGNHRIVEIELDLKERNFKRIYLVNALADQQGAQIVSCLGDQLQDSVFTLTGNLSLPPNSWDTFQRIGSVDYAARGRTLRISSQTVMRVAGAGVRGIVKVGLCEKLNPSVCVKAHPTATDFFQGDLSRLNVLEAPTVDPVQARSQVERPFAVEPGRMYEIVFWLLKTQNDLPSTNGEVWIGQLEAQFVDHVAPLQELVAKN